MIRLFLFLFVPVCIIAANRPNVLLIYTDDQGTFDLNCYGSTDLHTPHLDALAERGIRFTRFYAASSVCAPSRAALLTGRYPHRAGVPHNAESHPTQFGQGHGLAAAQITLAEVFRDAGYRTGHFGKWHLGNDPGPNAQGFEQSVGFMGGVVDKWSHFNYGQAPWGKERWHDWWRNGTEEWAAGRHTGDLIVDEALKFIQADDAPFFAYLAFGNPHYPVQPHNQDMRRFEHLDEPRRSYAAAMATLDRQIGAVLDALNEADMLENTIVAFQSDHGHSNEARNNYGGGNAGELRGAKASLFEGGLRVPAILSWPAQLPKNEIRDQFAAGCDWFPTLISLCGLDSVSHRIDGKNLLPILENPEAPTPHAYWVWALGKQWAVRQGNWKLLRHINDTTDGRNKITVEGPFLVNLQADSTESTNLAGDYLGRVEAMTALYERWKKSVTAE